MHGLQRVSILLVVALGVSLTNVSAQERYNRWNAQAVATPSATLSAQQRGAHALLAKARQDSLNGIRRLLQDSLRLLAVKPIEVRLQRGVAKRLKEGKALPTDIKGYEYLAEALTYPRSAIMAGTKGVVTLRLTVDADGQVVDAKVLQSSIPPQAEGRAAMLQQARLIVRGLRFEPAGITKEEWAISYNVL